MKTLILLNGSRFRRWNAGLPERLRTVAVDRGLPAPTIGISRSLEHMHQLLDEALASGVELVLSCGGDGALHHLVNHPGIERAVVSMLPAGTINAFLRAEGVPARRPIAAYERLLRGRVVEGHIGRLNGRRFACFASWGYDARVVHENPGWLKQRIKVASYGVTGVRELTTWNSTAVPGVVRTHGQQGIASLRATSVVITKIRNYAGVNAFETSVREPFFQGVASRSDHPLDLLALWASLGGRALTQGRLARLGSTRFLGRFDSAQWRSHRPAQVQLDGEAIVIPESESLMIDIDPVRQRYLLP